MFYILEQIPHLIHSLIYILFVSSAGNSAIKVRSSSSEEKSLQTPEATKWKSAQAAIAVSISPAAREAAKLNSEIIKEVLLLFKWVWKLAPYADGHCSHLCIYWQASSKKMWTKEWTLRNVPGNEHRLHIVSWQFNHQRSSKYWGPVWGLAQLCREKKIKIPCIRSSATKRKTLSNVSTSCSNGWLQLACKFVCN